MHSGIVYYLILTSLSLHFATCTEIYGVQLKPLSQSSLEVMWDQPEDAKYTNYLIKYWRESSGEHNAMKIYVPINAIRSFGAGRQGDNLHQLAANTMYCVRVAGQLDDHEGEFSKTVCSKTNEGVPAAPRRVQIEIVNSTAARISWRPPNPREHNGIITLYNVNYFQVDKSGQRIGLPLYTHTRPNEHTTIIYKLLPDTDYQVQISAATRVGQGERTLAKSFRTPAGGPGTPHDVHASLMPHSQGLFPRIRITWYPPERNDTKIASYRVKLTPGVEGKHHFDLTSQVGHTRHVFITPQLQLNTLYNVRVSASDGKTHGKSAHAQISTPNGNVTTAVRNVTSIRLTESEVQLTWEYDGDVKVSGFHVYYSSKPETAELSRWQHVYTEEREKVVLRELAHQTEYAVRIQAKLKDGTLGVLSKTHIISVKPHLLDDSRVNNLAAVMVTNTSFSLRWTRPITQQHVKHYQVSLHCHEEYRKASGELAYKSHERSLSVENTDRLSTAVEDLHPACTYHTAVRAIFYKRAARMVRSADVWRGGWTNITVSTLPGIPPAPVTPVLLKFENNVANIRLHRASEINGAIQIYQVIVVNEELGLHSPLQVNQSLLESSFHASEKVYIAAAFKDQTRIPKQWALGDSQQVAGGYFNRPLQKGSSYRVFVRVFTGKNRELFSSSTFSEILNTVESSESLLKGKAALLMIVAPVCGGILVILVLCLLILLLVIKPRQRRRRKAAEAKRNGQSKVSTQVMLQSTNGMNHLSTSLGSHLTLDRDKHKYSPVPSSIPSPVPTEHGYSAIPVDKFSEHIQNHKNHENALFMKEYETIEPNEQFTWDNSNLELNKPKNRYANVIAYDRTRVVLQPITNCPGSDYINANYIDGYKKQNSYIATQGPLPETFSDFWRMIWEQRSAVIVMMTKLEERQRVKCNQYWPSRGAEIYGMLQVTLIETLQLAYYTVRTFTIQKQGHGERREVRQFQFTAWPDHGVPLTPTPLLVFLRRVKALYTSDCGPLVVHCSAGVGRTAAFIALDIELERSRHEHVIDVYSCVTRLRAQRNYMVQTDDQYIFVHEVLLEAVTAVETDIPVHSLSAHVHQITRTDNSGQTQLTTEFKALESTVLPGKFISANLPVNKFKNRLVNVLPYEGSRVCLQSIRGVDGSDYINASHLDGYWRQNAYIATQGPLVETADDFWRMLWEQNSSLVVMLTRLREMGREKCYQYWPMARSARYQYFVVDPVAEYNMPQYILREFKVTDARDGQSRTIRQFQFTDWPEQGTPKTTDGLIDFIGQVHKTKEQFGAEGPITVHCSAGIGRTGVFILLSIALERMRVEAMVDLPNTLRIMRSQRHNMVQSEDQYFLCYRAVLEYLSSFDHYTS